MILCEISETFRLFLVHEILVTVIQKINIIVKHQYRLPFTLNLKYFSIDSTKKIFCLKLYSINNYLMTINSNLIKILYRYFSNHTFD